MEAQELPNSTETNDKPISNKKDRFTKLQSFLLIFATLVVSLGAGYFISDKYLWSNADEQRMIEQVDYYKGLVEADPNNAEHRVNFGYSYFLLGENEEAIKQLKMATDLDKDYFGAYFNLGLVYIDEERFNDALKNAQKTVELAPRNFKGHLLSGMVLRELKMYKEANESLREALNLAPTNNDIVNEIGRVAEDQGDFKEAEEYYKEALSYDPLYKPAAEGLDRIAGKDKSKDNDSK